MSTDTQGHRCIQCPPECYSYLPLTTHDAPILLWCGQNNSKPSPPLLASPYQSHNCASMELSPAEPTEVEIISTLKMNCLQDSL